MSLAFVIITDAKHKSSEGEFIPQTRPRSNTLPKSFGSSLDQEDEENEDDVQVAQKEKKPTKEATVELIFKRLKEKRIERSMPEDVKVQLVWSCLQQKYSCGLYFDTSRFLNVLWNQGLAVISF